MEQYIPKSVLVAEIEKIMNEQQEICKADVALGKNPDPKNIEVIYRFQQFIKFLGTFEMEEADLEKEMSEYFVEHPDEFFSDKYKLFAKHFFELGMRASNPLTWEDINLIDHLLFDIKEDYDNGKSDKEEYYKEVLKKFKAQKGESKKRK